MIVTRELGVDVLTAARQRIRNIFANGLPVYLGFSGGKDSLCLADVTARMVQAGEIDASRLRVQFVDEEAIFPCVEEVVRRWREKFLLMGAEFHWYCCEVKHFSCLNQLENDETFICWDSTKADRWIRRPPSFAIRNHPLLVPRKDTYQAWLSRICDGPTMTGLRLFESIQRRNALAYQSRQAPDLAKRSTVEPLYDWRDQDVWHYLLEHGVEIPAAYMHLYQIGTNARNLRISQFFSVDTAYSLARISEFYPDLMERILRREPSAYLVSLYWDSEMFRRRTRTRRAIEKKDEALPPRDEWRRKLFALMVDPKLSDGQRRLASEIRKAVTTLAHIKEQHYKDLYDALIAGDPKGRTLRAVLSNIGLHAAKTHVPGWRPAVINRAGSRGQAH